MQDVYYLNEEIFCLKYELNTLANVLLRSESERWVPGYLYKKTEDSHVNRYLLACEFSKTLNVMDIACGTGKGTNMLATIGEATTVSGFDIQPDAVRYAKWRNGSENITFKVKDAQALEIYNEYDLAVSFETIEHLPDYLKFLESIVKCLKPGGYFLVSTPISSTDIDYHPGNPYHVQEWGFKKFQEVLSEYFEIKKVYLQLYPPYPGILKRVYTRIKHKITGTNSSFGYGFSRIEEFTGQYPVAELGAKRVGYQIVLAQVRS